MSNGTEHSIVGGWLGTYAYEVKYKNMPPVRFEATFKATDQGESGGFTGLILDDSSNGEATAEGSQSGASIRFTKCYKNSAKRAAKERVEYSGAISADGMTMSGVWQQAIKGGDMSGVWDARRMWTETDEPEVVSEMQEMDAAGAALGL